MTAKQPVLLVVLVEMKRLGWRAAGVDLSGNCVPLLASRSDNLRPYIGQELDEQLSFLRHRLSGVLQRACDRLWGREMKPCQVVFLADGPFPEADPSLGRRVAEHFVEWMTKPPVVYYLLTSHERRAAGLERVSGEIDPQSLAALEISLRALGAASDDPDLWEHEQPKPRQAQ